MLKQAIIRDFNIGVYDPANGEVVSINRQLPLRADLSLTLLKRQFFSQCM